MKTRMKDPNYINISSLRYIQLQAMVKDVLRELLSYQGAHRINPSIKHIAWNTGWSVRSVNRALADLLDRELIEYEVWHKGHPQREGRPSNVYSLRVDKIRKAIAKGKDEHDRLFTRTRLFQEATMPSPVEFHASQSNNSELYAQQA